MELGYEGKVYKKVTVTDLASYKKLCLSTILAPEDGNLNEPVFKSSNAQGVSGGGDVEAFELIDALATRKQFELKLALNLSQ